MFDVDGSSPVADGGYFRIWRDGRVVGMQVAGIITDAQSDGWRDALAAEFTRGGYPRYYAMDVSGTDSQYSITAHLRTAAFVRETLKHVEWAALLTRDRGRSTAVAQSVLRLIGMGNLTVMRDRAAFLRMVAAMRQGSLPRIQRHGGLVDP